jgi:Domain of unknown function (DUF397)
MDLTPRTWRKSSYSGASSGNCIEVASAARNVAIRDSKDPNGPTLAFRSADWQAFTRRIGNGAVER